MAWGMQMQLAMIGLGRMGVSRVRRRLKQGPGCAVHDLQLADVTRLQADGAKGAASPARGAGAARHQRFASHGETGFVNQLLSAMRHEFSGHTEKPTGDST